MPVKALEWSFEGAKAEIIGHSFRGVPVKSLLISLPAPRMVLSTKEGFKSVTKICNHYTPEELWDFIHQHWQLYFDEILLDLKLSPDEVALIGTGVDMDDLALVTEESDGFVIHAFATAGIETNAMRIGVDRAGGIEREGEFEQIGTINIILLTDASLSEGAMARALVTVTEAKMIALEDLSVRSSYNPELQASGTGTDSIVVVSGNGTPITYTGGHCKMGELMARAVTSATKEALLKRTRNNLRG